MRNSRSHFLHAATVFFILTVVVALCSWVGSIYELGDVQNLISPEGLRWMLRNAVSQYVRTPALGYVLILFMGLGIAYEAGFIQSIWKFIWTRKVRSMKERRALILSLATLVIYTLLIFSITVTPWTILRNVTGTLENSPFLHGLPYIISVGIGFSGTMFGFVSGRFRTDREVIRGMGSLIARYYEYFIILFFVVQFFISLTYSRLLEWLHIGSSSLHLLFLACCYLPLAWIILRKE